MGKSCLYSLTMDTPDIMYSIKTMYEKQNSFLMNITYGDTLILMIISFN